MSKAETKPTVRSDDSIWQFESWLIEAAAEAITKAREAVAAANDAHVAKVGGFYGWRR